MDGRVTPARAGALVAAASWFAAADGRETGRDLGELLRSYRHAAGVTQQQVADMLGYDRTYKSASPPPTCWRALAMRAPLWKCLPVLCGMLKRSVCRIKCRGSSGWPSGLPSVPPASTSVSRPGRNAEGGGQPHGTNEKKVAMCVAAVVGRRCCCHRHVRTDSARRHRRLRQRLR